MTNREQFIASLVPRLRTHSAANPSLYSSPDSWEEVADFIADCLLEETTDLTNPIRATLKELDAEPTYAGAKDYLTRDVQCVTLSHD